MDIQKAEFQHEMKVGMDPVSLLYHENKREGITRPNTEKCSNDFNEKQILDEYFVPELIKIEDFAIKSEEGDGDQFSTQGFNEKEIEDDYFDSKSIKQEETDIKTENEEEEEFTTKSSADDGEKVLYPINQAVHLNNFLPTNIDNHQQHQLVHVPKEETKLHKCSKCPFSSKWSTALIRHLVTHKKSDETTWYQCSEYPYKTKREHKLQLHGNDQPVHKCTLCSYESFRKDNLQAHLNRVHRSKDLPLISCPEEGCSYKTHVQAYLQRHIRTGHNFQKIFKCSKCLYKTKYSGDLKAHSLRHENPDKWFSCPVCPFKTTYKFYLNNHSLAHKSDSEVKWFQCTECSYKTKNKQALAKHKVKHSSEAKEFTGWLWCYVCMWKTIYKHSLANHIRRAHRDAKGRIRGHL